MTILEDAVATHHTRLQTGAGVTVTYERTGTGSVTLTAVRSTPDYRTDDQTGLVDRSVDSEWIVKQSELVIGGNAIRPQRNDIIRQTINGQVQEFRVLGEPGLPHYEETDPFGDGFTIRAKLDEIT